MKKISFIFTLFCALFYLCGCGMLGFQYFTLEGHYQELEAEAIQLEKDNSSLNEQLQDGANQLENSIAQLEEKEDYIEGQKEYISELSNKVDAVMKMHNSLDDDEADEQSPYIDEDSDPFPDLYAKEFDADDENSKKIAYLTFDDGPSDLTPKVLELLDQYHAKATFFVVCKNNEEHEEYLSEIVKRGHTLALHSYSHNYSQIYASRDAFLEDYEKVFDWVVDNTGYTPSLFRFPGGSNNGSSYVATEIIQEMKRRGFEYFDWNVSSGDGSNLTTTDNIIDNICNNIKNIENPVVLMHDGSGKNATLAALPTVLKNLSEAGYEFRSLDKTVPPVHYR